MGRVGVNSLEEYRDLIKKDEKHKQKFLDFITINVTEFFRNPDLFIELQQIIKDNLLKDSNKLKIWSAACSIGCEPYSLAILLKRLTPNIKHNIIATKRF